jgi:TonB family protein
MDDSPFYTLSDPALPGSDSLPAPLRLKPPGAPRVSESVAMVDVLRQILSAGTRSTDSILRAATDAARVLTGAQGTALALRTNGVTVCRARSGTIAPELGAPLNVDSGISGECMRTATILVCNDAMTDTRVDPQVCHTLGVRSIVAVPVRGGLGIAGILEAFSTHAYAFGTEQIESLRALAEIAESAYEREYRASNQTPASVTAASSGSPMVASLDDAERTRVSRFSDEYISQRRYWVPGVAVLALILVSLVVWLSWREPTSEIATSQASTRPVSATEEPSGHPAPRVLPLKPDPGVAGHPSDRLRTKDVLQNAAEVESVTPGPHASDPAASSAADAPPPTPSENATAPSAPPPVASEPPPSIELAPSASSGELARLSSASAKLPAFGARVSTGVTDANLTHQVTPSYPQEARMLRLAGSVILDATIAVDGSVHDVRVVGGQPILAAAAKTAVEQWRYSPSVLSGKPIQVQKRITIIFKLP